MTSPILSRGQNLTLPAPVRRVVAVIGWADSSTEVDASALLLGADQKVRSDADFVFYNQPRSADGSVRFRVGDASSNQATIDIELPAVPDEVHTIALVGSIDSDTFGTLGELSLTILDDTGSTLAKFVTHEATTESAYLFGEIYRRADAWKVRAVGQGWDTGLAGLATDFGVSVDDDAGPSEVVRNDAPQRSVEQPADSAYRLWGQNRGWQSYELTIDDEFLPAIRSLYPRELSDSDGNSSPEAQLIPEPNGPRGAYAVSIRTGGRTIGYLNDDDAQNWSAVLRRILASGYLPTTSSKMWVSEYETWDGGLDLRANVFIGLEDPRLAIPVNDPPNSAYTLLPRSRIIQVTKEHEHFDALSKFVPEGGIGLLFVTLHENSTQGSRANPHIEVRIDDERIGQLTPQMSQRFLPMIRHLESRGLVTACWGEITGSAVAAKVRIDAIKANEASPDVLDGPPVTVPRLLPAMRDPLAYDLTAMQAHLEPLPPPPPVPPRPIPIEPVDGSVVRFTKGGSYTYVAVRRGTHWETTSSMSAAIDEVMTWSDLASRVRTFDIATDWAPVGTHGDTRILEHRAVVRFTIGSNYLAALNIDDGRPDGDWYTTVTRRDSSRLPLGDLADWSEIVEHGVHIQVATGWRLLE
ncbi:TerD family protein [Nocardia sp. NPDC005366]|uniref:TerD family protein n=1 Tax=Nocardia sp. NPDC005366 TaxID=3156878 RepID=UPI0033B9B4B0